MTDPFEQLQTEEHQAAANAERAKLKREQEIEDLKWLMGHAQGRRLATRIFARTGYRHTPFHTNGSTMAFKAGEQNIGLWLEAELVDAAPDGYFRLLKEFLNE